MKSIDQKMEGGIKKRMGEDEWGGTVHPFLRCALIDGAFFAKKEGMGG
jgi:hypothetical protein